MKNTALTVVIPTLNEEEDLPRTLASLGFADHLVVVDSGSTDNTKAIAQKTGARLVDHPFTSFSDTRNFGDSLVEDSWIMSLEADVVVPSELAEEIKKAIKSDKYQAYFIPRINVIWDKQILHTDWGPSDDCHIWLYRKGSGEWRSDVHEQFVTTKPTGKLENPLLHYNYKTVAEFINKTNSYSEMAITKPSFSLWIAPLRDFLKRYIYKGGFLDGYHGLFLSYLQAVFHLNVLVKSTVNSSK